jgi:hypothetical protein
MSIFSFNSGAFVLTSANFVSSTTLVASFNYPPDSSIVGYSLTVNGTIIPILSMSPGANTYEALLTFAPVASSQPAVLTVNGVTSAGQPVTPSSINLVTPVSYSVPGVTNDTATDILRRFLPPLYRNKPGWEALLAALATGDETVNQNAIAAFNQLFLSSASGNYLIERAADQGIQYPDNAGITEDFFRKLAILLANNRQTQQALLGILEVFYGYDSTHARLVSAAYEPFALTPGDTLTFNIDSREVVTFRIQASDYANLAQATASEVAAAITRTFQDAGSDAFASSLPVNGFNSVVVYSGAIGLLGSVEVTGGMANDVLKFATQISYINGGTNTWQRLLYSQDEFRLVWQGAAAPGNLNAIQVGDYVNLNCTGATELRGSYPVTSVHINASLAGSYAGLSWFSIKPPSGFPYTVVGGPATNFNSLPGEINFYQPLRSTVIQNSNPAFLAQHDPVSGVDVILPVTTQAVSRAYNAAAYLHDSHIQVDAVGPYVFDPAGLAVTAVETASTATVASGRGISVLPVASTVGFPAAGGYIALGFATKYEVGPVKYLGVLDSNNLSIDRSFVFPKSVPSGYAVTLLAQNTGYQPTSGADGFILTDSSAGRVAAEGFVDDSKAAGVNLNAIIVYPGDRGLGGQGDPITGAQISDKVGIWAGDNVDAAVEAAHNA